MNRTTRRLATTLVALTVATITSTGCSLMAPRDGDVTKSTHVDVNGDRVTDRTDVWVWQAKAGRSFQFTVTGDAPCWRGSSFNECSKGHDVGVPH